MFIKNDRQNTAGLAFRDLIFSSLFIFVAVVFFLLPFVNPVGEDDMKDIDQPGIMFVELIWEPDNNADVDLIIRDPNGEVTFFRNKATRVFNLLRDDRGNLDDDSGLNYEHAFSRSLPDGEYTINAYIFSLNEGRLPVKVWLTVSMKDLKSLSSNAEIVIREENLIDAVNKELTLIRFLVMNGRVIPNSFSYYTEEIIPALEFSTER
jgi:hypothetical protein